MRLQSDAAANNLDFFKVPLRWLGPTTYPQDAAGVGTSTGSALQELLQKLLVQLRIVKGLRVSHVLRAAVAVLRDRAAARLVRILSCPVASFCRPWLTEHARRRRTAHSANRSARMQYAHPY